MPLYKYQKAPVRFVEQEQEQEQQPLQSSPPVKKSKAKRLIPGAMITMGSVLLVNVAWPLIRYQVFTAPGIQKTEFVAPIPDHMVGRAASAPPQATPPPAPQVMGADLDYTDPKVWFPSATYAAEETQVKSYTISIPSVDIEDAVVLIGGEDLDRSLIQYPGTANPGQLGSPVIFGHSILRQFYNPAKTNPNRYNSIFSKVMTLKSGDMVYVDYDGIEYAYEVKDKVEVQPEDVFILEQRYSNRELKLITCVPEGTYLRRGVVLAQLVDINQEGRMEDSN